MKKAVRLLAVTAVVSMVAVACSNDSSSTATSAGGSTSTGAATIGPGEGALSLIAWPGYTEDSWVKPFEQDTGCKVDVKYGNTSDDMVNLMRQGGGTLYDGVSASGDASNRLIAGRRRRRDRHGDVRRLRRRDAVAAVPGAQHRERTALRRPVHVGPEPAPVQHGRREAGADQLGRRVRRQQPVRGQGHRVRQPDLHRGCGAVPEGDAARPRHHRSVRAHERPARRGDRTAEDAVRADRQVLGAVHGRDQGLRFRRHGDRDRVAGEPAVHRAGQQGAGGVRRSRPKGSRGGPTPG